MAGQLVALDKQPGVHPLGVGNALRRLMAKLVLCAVGDQATQQCGNYNLCVRLKAGIEGAVHVIHEAEAAAAAAAALTADPTSAENSAYNDKVNGTARAVALAGGARAPPEQGTQPSDDSDDCSDSDDDDDDPQVPTQDSALTFSHPFPSRFRDEQYETASMTQTRTVALVLMHLAIS